MRRTGKILVLIFLLSFLSIDTYALEKPTHKALNVKAADISNFHSYLIDQLGFLEGRETIFNGNRAIDWFELGGKSEDEPAYTRSRNHFHNPLLLWDQAGLNSGIFTGQSSVLWMQDQSNRRLTDLGGDWSWRTARKFYYAALIGDSTALDGFEVEESLFNSTTIVGKTNMNETERNQFFGWTFRAVGQAVHLVQDASVPAHVRNDVHILYNYEDKVDNIRSTDPAGFQNLLSNPLFFSGTISNIASFIDTDQYDGSNPDITNSTAVGLSEYTNANFFSEDTNAIESTSFTYPQITEDTDIVEKEFVNNNVPLADLKKRQYYKKNYDGEKYGVDGTGYLLSGVDYFEYYRKSLNPIGAQKLIAPLLDYNVYEDYASLLIPRAVGYSAGLLNYFFRGEIEVDLIDAESFTITNSSSETMDGIFTLYYDATDENRHPVSDGSWYRSLQPVGTTGDTSDELSFTEPTDIAEDKQYILVFEGTLGSEYNAVVGKVFSGAGCLDSAKFAIDSVVGKTVTVTPDENLCLNNFLWDWGDNQYNFDTGQGTRTHTYERAGTYNIKLTAYLPNPDDAQNVVVTSDNYHSSMGNHIVPFDDSNAGAYAQFIALPWEPGLANFQYRARATPIIPGLTFYSYWLSRTTGFAVPFSQIAANPSVISGKAFVWIQGRHTSYIAYDDDGGSKPIILVVSGSDAGMTTYEKKTGSSTSDIATMVDITTPMVDSVYGFIDQSGGDPLTPDILPDPLTMSEVSPGVHWSGWICPNSPALGGMALRVTPYHKKKELTKTITVQ